MLVAVGGMGVTWMSVTAVLAGAQKLLPQGRHRCAAGAGDRGS
jgi:predicted metal-binding membrane protein